MAITGAITLGQIAKTSDSKLERGIIMNLIRDSQIFERIPFKNVDQLANINVRWTNLPTPDWRQLNAGYTASVGDVDQVTETLYIVGGEFKVDRILKKVKGLVTNPVALQIAMHNKALAFELNDKFINGDHVSDADSFEGLKKRVAGMPSRQTIYFAGASSAPLDPSASTANGATFLRKLNEMWKFTNNKNVSMLIANEGVELGINHVLNYLQIGGGGMLDVTQDTFGRDITTYRGVPVLDAGLKADQSTQIITDTEVAGDAGADSTSMYGVSFDEMEGLMGIQLGPIDFYDPLKGGEMEGSPTGITRYDWALGLNSPGSHGITRGRNLEAASDWT